MSSQVFGLVSGIDTGKLIEATLNARRAPIRAAQRRKAGVNAQISQLSSLISKMDTLKTTLESLEKNKDVLALSATSTDEDVLTVTADGDSSPGTYDINVTALAGAAKHRADAFADNFDPVKGGTISITVDGGDTVDITIDDGDALSEVVDKINASDAEVYASLIFDGTNYTMQVVNQSTGYTTDTASEGLIITENYTGATGAELNLTEVMAAANAVFTVDGLPVEVQDNSVADVLEGVTMELDTLGQSYVTIDKDKTGTKENLQEFVDSYNAVMSVIKDQMVVEEGEQRGRKLAGEPFLTRLKSDLQDIVTREIEGLTGSFESLAMIGITTDTKSKLVIDSDDLDDALDQDINGVGDVFTFDTAGITEALMEVVDRYVDGTESVLKERKEAFGDRIDDFNDRIASLEERLATMRKTMTKRFTILEQTMSTLNQQSSALLSLVTGNQSN